MGKKGHVGDGSSSYAEKLDKEPKSQNDQSRYADNFYKDEDKEQGENAGAREEEQIGPQNSTDGPAGADHRDRRIRIGKNLGRPCAEPANKVKEQEAKMAEGIFNVVSKNPEVKHIPDKVQDPPMEEHGGK